jgi:hypothetical protein
VQTSRSGSGTRLWLGGLTVLLCGLGLAALRFDAYIAHDEGLVGQVAERTLHGELPHVDFDDTYTGGQAFLHAAAFDLFGARSATLRDVLLAAALAFIATLYWIADRFFGPWAAAALTLLAVVWSLACYFAPLPSWYNLFLTVFGLAALLVGTESRRRWPALAAGFCAGLSILIKVIGVYFVLFAALALIYQQQVRSRAAAGEADRASHVFRGLVGALIAISLGGLGWVLRRAATPLDFLMFMAPIAGMVLLLAVEELRPKALAGRERWRDLLPDLALLAIGVAVPILVFLIPYASIEGGLADLWRGVLVLPQGRFLVAQQPMPSWPVQLLGLPIFLMLLLLRRRHLGWIGLAVVVAMAVALLIWGQRQLVGHAVVWASLRSILPLVATWSAFDLARAARPDDARRWLLLAFAAFFNLVQFPLGTQQYLHFELPLTLLATALWLGLDRSTLECFPLEARRRAGLWTAYAFFYFFAALWVHFSSPFALGLALEPKLQTTWLAPDRVGLRVTAAHAELYSRLIDFTQRVVPPEQPILALPDLPQVYFFTQRRNPTRFFFDALAAKPPQPDDVERWLGQVGLVVINREPDFSPPIDAATEALIDGAFPERFTLGPMEVRYRRSQRGADAPAAR